MSHYDQPALRTAQTPAAVDRGLRRYMIGVYNKVALGLLVSAGLAYVTSAVAPVRDLLFRVTAEGRFAGYTGLGLAVAFAPVIVLLVATFAMRRASVRGAGLLFFSISALLGASLGVLGLVYTGASLAGTFLITAAAFGALSLAGYATKKDLSGLGSFLMVGLVGLILASLVRMFWNPPGFSFVVSAAGVLIFAGLIAYDTQRLKMTYYELSRDEVSLGVASSFGALSLYLDFINLFQFLLNLFGERR